MQERASNPLAAIGFMVIATVFIGGSMILAKLLQRDALGDPLHALQVSHGRFLFAWLAIVVSFAVFRPALSRPNMRLHLIRASFGWMGVTLMFAAVAFIPMSDATAITFLNPVFAMALAIPVLGERVGPIRWVAAAIALAGAMILLRPGPGTFQAAALLSLISAVFFGVEIVCIKRLSRWESATQILLINNSIGLVLSSLALIAVWQVPSPTQWLGLAGLGGLMACAQTCYLNALMRADASLVVPFSYGTLIFASLYDFAVFDAVPDSISVLGAGVIILGAGLLALREARAARLRQVAPNPRLGVD